MESIGFTCKKKKIKPKKQVKSEKKFRLSRGVAVRALVEICVDDISAVLRATDLRFRLPFVTWAGLMHLILRILKSLEQTQESKKFKINFDFFCKNAR
jgi:hypothetical protein